MEKAHEVFCYNSLSITYAARYEEKMFSENFSMEAYEDVLEEEPDILPGKKKRKRQKREKREKGRKEKEKKEI